MRPAFLSLALMTVLLGSGCSTASRSASVRSGKRIDTDYSKRGEVVFTPANWPKELRADIYQPKGDGPWPAVLLVYGGSWSSADHRWQMTIIARRLARRGFVVMNTSYRGLPKFRFPAPADDLREALRWMRAHAAEYHINAQKVAAYGFSAGGHLAALVGMMDGPAEVRVQAVVAASTPADLTLFPGGDLLPRFLGATYEENPQIFREASPVFHVTSDDPPVFIYHGSADTTVSPEHATVFQSALTKAGVRNELHWGKDKGHAGTLIFGGEAAELGVDFLDDVLR